MAFQIAIEHESGVILNYWAISTTDVCWYIGGRRIMINGFIDHQARLDGKVPLDCKIYQYMDADFHVEPDDNLIQVAYDAATRIFTVTYIDGAAYTVGGVRYTPAAGVVTRQVSTLPGRRRFALPPRQVRPGSARLWP